MRGGIFLRKMTLGVYVSVKGRIETAVAAAWQEAWGRGVWSGMRRERQRVNSDHGILP
jgi:hypothetical protein